jgi:hypothetical protein
MPTERTKRRKPQGPKWREKRRKCRQFHQSQSSLSFNSSARARACSTRFLYTALSSSWRTGLYSSECTTVCSSRRTALYSPWRTTHLSSSLLFLCLHGSFDAVPGRQQLDIVPLHGGLDPVGPRLFSAKTAARGPAHWHPTATILVLS